MIKELEQLNVIDLKKYYSEIKYLRKHISPESEFIKFPILLAYDTIQRNLKERTIFFDSNQTEFIDACNKLFSKQHYDNHDWMQHYPIGELTFLENDGKKQIVNKRKGNITPLTGTLDGYFNEYAFFTTDDSKESVEGIYLSQTLAGFAAEDNYPMFRNFIMTPNCYEKLVRNVYNNK